MYSELARYYDKIYGFKDYPAEAQRLKGIIAAHLRSGGRRLLDAACGTGKHLSYLKEEFDVQGLDVSEEMLQVAQANNPDVLFHRADMAGFHLDCQFDVITCLFGSIGYLTTFEKLQQALDSMSRHLLPGGLLLIEPWFTPETWRPDTVHSVFVDEPELKIARINTSLVKGRRSYFDFHYLIGTPRGTSHFVEHHELGLFTTEELLSALSAAGLEPTYDAEGLMGRGLFISVKPLSV
jgi:SAM-dependent methyltransferase